MSALGVHLDLRDLFAVCAWRLHLRRRAGGARKFRSSACLSSRTLAVCRWTPLVCSSTDWRESAPSKLLPVALWCRTTPASRRHVELDERGNVSKGKACPPSWRILALQTTFVDDRLMTKCRIFALCGFSCQRCSASSETLLCN